MLITQDYHYSQMTITEDAHLSLLVSASLDLVCNRIMLPNGELTLNAASGNFNRGCEGQDHILGLKVCSA